MRHFSESPDIAAVKTERHSDRILLCVVLRFTLALRCLVLRWSRGRVPPESLVASPQIQKLADRSDVISEVPKCSKIQLGSLQRSPHSLADGEGARCPLPRTPPPFGPRFYRSQGLTHYRVGNPTNDKFQM